MLQEAAMDRARSLRRIISVLCGAGLLLAALAQPASAQIYYTCPPGYYYAEPGTCVPSDYYYGPPYFYGPSYYGFVPFGFTGFGHRGFGRGGFGHGGVGFGHGGGHR
jgi:hypothetical protein